MPPPRSLPQPPSRRPRPIPSEACRPPSRRITRPPLPGTLSSLALLNNRSAEMEVDVAVRRRRRRHDEADERKDLEEAEHDPRDRHALPRLRSAGAIDLTIRDESEDQRQDRDDREEHE